MRPLLALALLLCAVSSARAVEWPVIGGRIEHTGGTVAMTISTSPDLTALPAITNGNFFGGWRTNDIVELTPTNSLWLDVASPGYGTDGATNITVRRIYGSKIKRMAFGMMNTNDIVAENTTNVVAKVWLTGDIFTNETVLGYGLTGWFATTNGTRTNAAAFTGITITNGSVQPYPSPIARFIYPGYQWITNYTMRLYLMGGHISAQEGRPLQALKVITRDELGNSNNTFATMQPVLELFTNGMGRTAVYVADVDMTGFVTTNRIRCDFIAYPRWGNNAFNTMADPYTGITPHPTSITNFFDTNRAYSGAIAIIDSIAGNDTNGRATNGSPTDVHANLYFKTLPRALDEVCKTNNAIYGHNDGGGGIIYWKVATNWMGSVSGRTYGVPYQGKVWTSIEPYPGSFISITSNAAGSNQRLSNNIRISGITMAGGTVTYLDVKELWFDGVVYSNTAATPTLATPRAWFTRSTIPKAGSSGGTGLMANSSDTTCLFMVGNNMDGSDCGIHVGWLAIGNSARGMAVNKRVVCDASGQPVVSNYGIVYNNYIGGFVAPNQANVDFGLVSGIGAGMLIAQNIFEIATNAANSTFNMFSANTLHFTNVLLWRNLWLGKRIAGVMYNDSGAAAAWRMQCQGVGNVMDNSGFKGDTQSTGNGARIGNASAINQVNWRGNYYVEGDTSGFDSPGAFNPEFAGIDSYHPQPLGWANGGGDSYTNSVGITKFVDRRSAGAPVQPPAGSGDYRLQTSSPLFRQRGGWVLPFDIDGKSAGAIDPPGVYQAGNARKGAFF